MRLVIQSLISNIPSTAMTSPLRPTPISGSAAAFEVRCPLCAKLHARRPPRILVTVIVVLRGDSPNRGLVIKCRCGAWLELVEEREAA